MPLRWQRIDMIVVHCDAVDIVVLSIVHCREQGPPSAKKGNMAG